MNKIYTFLFLLFTLFFQSAFAQDNNHVPGNFLVMLQSENSIVSLETDLSRLNGKSTHLKMERPLSNSMHIYLFSFDNAIINEELLLTAVRNHPDVKIVQYNHYINERNTVPNDPQFGVMWDMDNTGANGGSGSVADADIDAPEAWDITTGGLTSQGDSIVVAVVDLGFSLTHPDLNFWKNYDEIPNNGIDDDLDGYIDDFDGWNSAAGNDNWTPQTHGTHVSGTVGAKGNNGIGVTGVNWNVKVMPVSYGSGGSFEANVVAAYSFVRDQRRQYDQSNGTKGAFVVATNSSFGVDLAQPSAYPLWCAMYDSLGAVGILSAGATANANYNVDTQGDIPTACPSNWLITVTNLKNNDTRSTAAYGATTIDLGAPGVNITSTAYSTTTGTNTYALSSGTSMATPHVAGTIGLLYSVACPQFIANYKADPAGIALMVKDSILGAVDPVANLFGMTVTGGRLNLYKAVKAIQNYCTASGINESAQADNAFQISTVYPNPASKNITVVINTFENSDIILTNILGQEMKRVRNENSIHGKQLIRMDVSDISNGIYFVRLENKSKRSAPLKIIVY